MELLLLLVNINNSCHMKKWHSLIITYQVRYSRESRTDNVYQSKCKHTLEKIVPKRDLFEIDGEDCERFWSRDFISKTRSMTKGSLPSKITTNYEHGRINIQWEVEKSKSFDSIH
jgi:hypothetical protein